MLRFHFPPLDGGDYCTIVDPGPDKRINRCIKSALNLSGSGLSKTSLKPRNICLYDRVCRIRLVSSLLKANVALRFDGLRGFFSLLGTAPGTAASVVKEDNGSVVPSARLSAA